MSVLQPQPGSAGDDEDLRQQMTVPVETAAARFQLHRPVCGQRGKRLLRLVDERPGILAPPAERGQRRLGADQPDGPAVGELERLAIDDGCDHAGLRRRQVAGARGADNGEPSRRGKAENSGCHRDHAAS